MKSVKRIYKCTDCSTGPCFAIVPIETFPEYCSVEVEIKEGANDAYVDPVNWLEVETIHSKIGIFSRTIKEILDA